MCVCVRAPIWMWQSLRDVRHLPSLFTLSEVESLSETQTRQYKELTSQLTPATPVYLPRLGLQVSYRASPAFMWALGSELWSACLHRKPFNSWATSPVLGLCCFTHQFSLLLAFSSFPSPFNGFLLLLDFISEIYDRIWHCFPVLMWKVLEKDFYWLGMAWVKSWTRHLHSVEMRQN